MRHEDALGIKEDLGEEKPPSIGPIESHELLGPPMASRQKLNCDRAQEHYQQTLI